MSSHIYLQVTDAELTQVWVFSVTYLCGVEGGEREEERKRREEKEGRTGYQVFALSSSIRACSISLSDECKRSRMSFSMRRAMSLFAECNRRKKK
jgi:hypothetical protein